MTNRSRMTNCRSVVCVAALITACGAAGWAADWPQWRGPRRDGQSAEKGWLAGWPEGKAPRAAWRVGVGKGHSAVSISGGRAYTLGWDGKLDTVACLDAGSGKQLWQQSYPCDPILQWPGPRSTPTVDGDTVYTLGQHGQLHAWHCETGAPRWQRKLAATYNPDVDYGFAWSPLIAGNLLLLSCGSKGLALRRTDGASVWGDDGQHGACASPVPFTQGATPGAAFLITDPGRDSVSLVGVEVKTGRQLWRSPPWVEKWGAACVDPLISEQQVFVTTAEQYLRCARFTIKDGRLNEDWSNRNLASYTGSCVLVSGCVYGVNRQGRLKCLDWNSGAEKWSEPGFGTYGTLTSADGKLIIQTSQSGELIVADANPAGYRELRRTKVFNGPPETFTVPVLSGGRIYCRSYAGEVVCLDVWGPR